MTIIKITTTKFICRESQNINMKFSTQHKMHLKRVSHKYKISTTITIQKILFKNLILSSIFSLPNFASMMTLG